MAHFEDPLDAEAVETQRNLTVWGVKKRFRIARRLQRGVLALTVGTGVGCGIAYAYDVDAVVPAVNVALPLGIASTLVQSNAKRRSAYLVGEFLRFKTYAEGDYADYPDMPEDKIPQVKTPQRRGYEHLVSPEVSGPFSNTLLGYGTYGITADILAGQAESAASTVGYIGVLAGTAFYTITEQSMNAHEQVLLNQLAPPDAA